MNKDFADVITKYLKRKYNDMEVKQWICNENGGRALDVDENFIIKEIDRLLQDKNTIATATGNYSIVKDDLVDEDGYKTMYIFKDYIECKYKSDDKN